MTDDSLLRAEIVNIGGKILEVMDVQANEIRKLKRKLDDAEIEIAAAKEFGCGFYSGNVREELRDVYRDRARKRFIERDKQLALDEAK
jgi:hypothetical protein